MKQIFKNTEAAHKFWKRIWRYSFNEALYLSQKPEGRDSMEHFRISLSPSEIRFLLLVSDQILKSGAFPISRNDAYSVIRKYSSATSKKAYLKRKGEVEDKRTIKQKIDGWLADRKQITRAKNIKDALLFAVGYSPNASRDRSKETTAIRNAILFSIYSQMVNGEPNYSSSMGISDDPDTAINDLVGRRGRDALEQIKKTGKEEFFRIFSSRLTCEREEEELYIREIKCKMFKAAKDGNAPEVDRLIELYKEMQSSIDFLDDWEKEDVPETHQGRGRGRPKNR